MYAHLLFEVYFISTTQPLFLDILEIIISKETGDRTRQRKKPPTSAGIQHDLSIWATVALPTELEGRRDQVVGNYGGNCNSTGSIII